MTLTAFIWHFGFEICFTCFSIWCRLVFYNNLSFRDKNGINQCGTGRINVFSDLIFDGIAHFPVGFKPFNLSFVAILVQLTYLIFLKKFSQKTWSFVFKHSHHLYGKTVSMGFTIMQ